MDMISMEHDLNYQKRVLFNRPFKDIDVLFLSSTDYISDMNRDKHHILWLDYDGPIDHDCLVDIEMASSFLTAGSILIVTFDVDFDKADDINIKESLPNKRAQAWFKRFQDECGEMFDPAWKSSHFNATSIPKRTTEVVKNAIYSGLNMRDGITFEPLFNFLYADGHQMLTIGGVICSKQEKRKLRLLDWEELPFIRRKLSMDPFEIKVPVLTRKERLYVDSHMPSEHGWVPKEFEIDETDIKDYREVYRYCPLYAELLL